jgi:predicted N-acetyltransferase YhbS
MQEAIAYKKLETNEEIIMARELMLEYIQWLNTDLTFQNIEDELKYFPRKYQPPEGEFIIAKENSTVIGCVAMRKLESAICEMKRLFVKDAYQKRGIGKQLVEMIIGVVQ